MLNNINRYICLPLLSLLVCSLFIPSSPLEAASYERRRAHTQIRKSGDYGQFAIPIAAACIAALHRDAQGLGFYASSFGATLGVSYVIKPTLNSTRPNGGNMSFPSGHTAAAMGGAAFLQMRYGLKYGLPFYLAATYVGFSRVYAFRHWPCDVLGATAIALAANALLTKPFKNRKYIFVPIVTPGQAGIAVCWRW